MIETTITDTNGIECRYHILYLPRQDAWRVLGEGIDVFVPFDAVGFPTVRNVVTRAYELDERQAVAS